jgi:predicted nucleic acid-binding protein
MILVDTGPLVALFDPADGDHKRCASLLAGIDEPLKVRKIFTIDRNDFATYRLRQGHRYLDFEVLS